MASPGLAEIDPVALADEFAPKFRRLPFADVEDAVQEGIIEILRLADREPLDGPPAALVRQRVRWQLLHRVEADRREVPLERDEDDEPHRDLAVDTTDVAGETAERVDVDSHPVRRHLVAAAEAGVPAQMRRRGTGSHCTRYPAEMVERARALRRQGLTYPEVAALVGCRLTTVERWIRDPRRVLDNPGWTRETSIAAVLAWVGEHGRPPTYEEARADRMLPALKSWTRIFGGFNAMLEAAGLPTRRPGWANVNG